MTLTLVAKAIREKFRDDVAVPNSLIVVHDNEPPKAIVQTWCRLTVLADITTGVYTGAAGQRRTRTVGRAVVNIFRPVAKGDGEMLDLFEAIAAVFYGSSIASPIVLFRDPPTLVGPVQIADVWFQRTMDIPFEADLFR